MLKFISKEDRKKIIQEVRRNKEKDVKMWKYMMGKSLECLFLGIFLAVMLGVELLEFELAVEDFAVRIIFLVIAVISIIRAFIDIEELDWKCVDKKSKE